MGEQGGRADLYTVRTPLPATAPAPCAADCPPTPQRHALTHASAEDKAWQAAATKAKREAKKAV